MSTINTNKIIISGRLTADPELRKTSNDVSLCKVIIAVNNGDKDPDFFPVVCWRNTAEAVCEYRKKGDGVIVIGKLHNRFYVDKETNDVRKISEITAEQVEFTTTAQANDKNDKVLDEDYTTQEEIDKIREAVSNLDDLPF